MKPPGARVNSPYVCTDLQPAPRSPAGPARQARLGGHAIIYVVSGGGHLVDALGRLPLACLWCRARARGSTEAGLASAGGCLGTVARPLGGAQRGEPLGDRGVDADGAVEVGLGCALLRLRVGFGFRV